MDVRRQLGDKIRSLRTMKALTLEELASRAGMDYTHVSGIERGRRNPSFAALVDICRALEVHPRELVQDLVIGETTPPLPRKRGPLPTR